MTNFSLFQHILDSKNHQPKYRYFRITILGESFLSNTKHQLSSFFNDKIERVSSMLPNIYKSKFDLNFSKNELYRKKFIFPMDLGSIIAVLNLNICSTDQILDLCCAPGAKLCYIINLLKEEEEKYGPGLGSVTGIDSKLNRLHVTRNLTKRNKLLDKVRLFQIDGTNSSKIILNSLFEVENNNMALFNNICKIKPIYASKKSRSNCYTFDSAGNIWNLFNEYLYDKVIVDAECTHDGSYIHNIKLEETSWKEKHYAKNLENLYDLQLKLLINGYNYTKSNNKNEDEGGIIVYSTCSLTLEQNEEILLRFLNYLKSTNQRLPRSLTVNTYNVDCFQFDLSNLTELFGQEYGLDLLKIVQKGVRFCPLVSKCSGLFIIKLQK